MVVFTLIHRVKQWQQMERDWSHSSHEVDNEGEGSSFKYVHNSKKNMAQSLGRYGGISSPDSVFISLWWYLSQFRNI